MRQPWSDGVDQENLLVQHGPGEGCSPCVAWRYWRRRGRHCLLGQSEQTNFLHSERVAECHVRHATPPACQVLGGRELAAMRLAVLRGRIIGQNPLFLLKRITFLSPWKAGPCRCHFCDTEQLERPLMPEGGGSRHICLGSEFCSVKNTNTNKKLLLENVFTLSK